jgi:hypothetical protein
MRGVVVGLGRNFEVGLVPGRGPRVVVLPGCGLSVALACRAGLLIDQGARFLVGRVVAVAALRLDRALGGLIRLLPAALRRANVVHFGCIYR